MTMTESNSTLIIEPQFGSYSNSFQDKRETEELVKRTGCEKGAGRARFDRFKVSKENVLGEINKIHRDTKAIFENDEKAKGAGLDGRALPHVSGGYLVAAKDRQRYEAVLDKAVGAMAPLKRELIRQYPSIVRESKVRLGRVGITTEYPEAEELARKWCSIQAIYRQEPFEIGTYGATAAIVSEVINKTGALASHRSDQVERSIGKVFAELTKVMETSHKNLTESHNKKNGRLRQDNINKIVRKASEIRAMADRYGVSGIVGDHITKVCNTIASNLEHVDLSTMTAPPDREEVLNKIEKDIKIVTTTSEDIMSWGD